MQQARTEVDDGATPLQAAGFIFDLDGVLLDTAVEHDRIWRLIAAEIQSCAPDSVFKGLRGVGREACLEAILAHAPPAARRQAPQLLARKNELYRAAVAQRGRDLLVPGAGELLAELRAQGFRLAVASASRNAREILAYVGVAGMFDIVSDGCFLGPPKPAPDQIESVSVALDLQPSRLVLIEDSERGAAAGTAAGVRVVGVGPAIRRWPGLVGWTESLRGVDAHGLLSLAYGDRYEDLD